MALMRFYVTDIKTMLCEVSLEPGLLCDRFECIHHLDTITDLCYHGLSEKGKMRYIDVEAMQEFRKEKSEHIIECECPYQNLPSDKTKSVI